MHFLHVDFVSGLKSSCWRQRETLSKEIDVLMRNKAEEIDLEIGAHHHWWFV